MKYWIMGIGLLCIFMGVLASLSPNPSDLSAPLGMGTLLVFLATCFFIFEPPKDKK